MIKLLAKNTDLDSYYITVIDHINQTFTDISLQKIRDSFDSNLRQFDCVVMAETTHNAIKSDSCYKPANSTLIVKSKVSQVKSNREISFSDYSTLSCKFANPQLFSDLFIDKIELTVPLKKTQARKLHKILSRDQKSKSRISFKTHLNSKAVKYRCSFIVAAKNLGSIHLMFNPVSKKINQLKVSYNPSSYNPRDIEVLTKKLRKLCGKDYPKVIMATNITRFDATFDSDGYLIDDVLFNIDKSSHFKIFVSADGVPESIISGADGSKRAQFYDKTAEQLNEGIIKDPSAVSTRFEVTIRPHNIKGINGIKLGHLYEEQELWPHLNIYDNHKLRNLIGDNIIDWEIAKYFGISALRRTKNNTERVKLSNLLNECKLEINESEFNLLIREKLTEIYKEFLGVS